MNDQNDNPSISDELEKSAVTAASTAKTAVRLAGSISSGNAVGAVKALLEDENTRRLIISLICIFSLILVMVMYILPMSIYEGIETVTAASTESFYSSYYSGEGGNVLSAAWSFLKTFISSLWQSAVSSVSQYTGSDASLFYTDADNKVIDEKDAPGDSVYAKLKAAKEKYSIRKNQIVQNIEAQSYNSVYNKALSYFNSSYEQGRDIFNGFVWDESGCLRELSDLTALKLAALYAVMNDNDFSNTKLSDYMQWLGYDGDNNTAFSLSVFGEPVLINGWTGTFMPQYLHDEAKDIASQSADTVKNDLLKSAKSLESFRSAENTYNERYREAYKTYTDRYGTAAIDMIIKAYVASTMTSTYQSAYRYIPDYSGAYSLEEYSRNSSLQEELSKYSDPEHGYVTKNTYTQTSYRYSFHYKNQVNIYYYDEQKQQYYMQTHNGKRMPYRWTANGSVYLPENTEYIYINFYERYKIVTYTAYINVVPRSFDVILALAGIKEGLADSVFSELSDDLTDYTEEPLAD